MKLGVFFILVWIWSLFSLLKANGIRREETNEQRLVKDLLNGYDKRVRPVMPSNTSLPLNVTFGLALSQIIDVDEKNQILTTNCWLNQMWTDYGLRWDPKEYGDIKVVRLPYDQIWRPDIFLYNNADVSTYFSSISSNVIVTSQGNVTWLSMVIFKSSCSINVRYFPFDEQNCSMTFASWTYDGFHINLILNTLEGDISNYIPNSEWHLHKLYVDRKVVYYSCCAEPYPDITFYIHILRRPLFYVFNMVMPCIMITLVALLGFYIPSDSGEKVTMGITTLLSMTVFMMLVAENMPPTSDVLPLIGIYYGLTIIIVSLATGMTVFTLNIHHKGQRGHPVSPIIRKIFFGVFARVMCVKMDGDYNRNSSKYTPDFASNVTNNYTSVSKGSEVERTKLLEDGVRSCCCNLDRQAMNHAYEMKPENNVRKNHLPEQHQNNQPIFAAPNNETTSTLEHNFTKVLSKVCHTIENNESRQREQDVRESVRFEWQQLALVVDRMLLTVFVLITLIMTSAILMQGPLSQSDNP
ncbi:neuronal acetylcholine receptor subunit alpha-10-like isoform X2 [Crassostrea angulata]|uniref:neuronal acetylcholine receptor subunit alpha-10-like isoform X2 n=1 Tax=Magallana angulata TaxID=2784310 RepID=UPI0022B12147|nr:neuronal acetylcholine receptor subunit alpha-10-like isoform X2 [Crassostrea angulata]